MTEERNVIWKCVECSTFHNWTWEKWDIFPGEVTMICDSCGAETKMNMDVDKNGNGLAMPLPEDTELEEKIQRVMSKVMDSKTEIEPQHIIKDGDYIYFRGEKYQKIEPEEPKTLFDVIRNLGYSVDACYEIVDAIEAFQKSQKYQPTPQTPEQVSDGLKEAFREAVKNGIIPEIKQPTDELIEKLTKNPPQFLKFELGKSLTDIIHRWWEDVFTTHSDWDMETSIEDLVDQIQMWLPKEQSAAGSQNVYVECSVEGFNDAIQKIKRKLR